jgi:hypothetical protein
MNQAFPFSIVLIEIKPFANEKMEASTINLITFGLLAEKLRGCDTV